MDVDMYHSLFLLHFPPLNRVIVTRLESSQTPRKFRRNLAFVENAFRARNQFLRVIGIIQQPDTFLLKTT